MNPCTPPGLLRRLTLRWRAHRRGDAFAEQGLRLDGDAFEFERHTVDHHDCRWLRVEWSNVDKIMAWVEDLYIHDLVMVGIQAGDDHLVFSEQTEGFQEFTLVLPDVLPGAQPWSDWFLDLTAEAFSDKRLVLYQRDRQDS